MARNQNRKKQARPLNAPAESTETTSIRQRPRRIAAPEERREDRPDRASGTQRGQTRWGRTFPTGRPLVGSEVLEAIGSKGTVVRAMHDVIHAPDDERVVTRLGPEQEASVRFETDQSVGDAGADFAEEFGRDFLVAATTGEDIGEIESAVNDASPLGEPFLHVTDELEDVTDDAELTEEEVPPSKKALGHAHEPSRPAKNRRNSNVKE